MVSMQKVQQQYFFQKLTCVRVLNKPKLVHLSWQRFKQAKHTIVLNYFFSFSRETYQT